MLSDSNTNVNSMINRRVSLFYRYPLKAFHHMVCPCTLGGVCVVCPGSELVGQQEKWSDDCCSMPMGKQTQWTLSQSDKNNSNPTQCPKQKFYLRNFRSSTYLYQLPAHTEQRWLRLRWHYSSTGGSQVNLLTWAQKIMTIPGCCNGTSWMLLAKWLAGAKIFFSWDNCFSVK